MFSIIRSKRREAEVSYRSRLLRCVAASALAVVTGLWASAASAEVLLFSSNIQGQFFNSVGFVDLNGPAAGGTTLSFSTTAANQRVSILFNAECAVEGAVSNYVDVDIVVDPAGSFGPFDAPPTNGDNALCSGNGTATAASDGWVSAVTIATARPAVAGTHTVRVRVHPIFGAFFLDDLSLTVLR